MFIALYNIRFINDLLIHLPFSPLEGAKYKSNHAIHFGMKYPFKCNQISKPLLLYFFK